MITTCFQCKYAICYGWFRALCDNRSVGAGESLRYAPRGDVDASLCAGFEEGYAKEVSTQEWVAANIFARNGGNPKDAEAICQKMREWFALHPPM